MKGTRVLTAIVLGALEVHEAAGALGVCRERTPSDSHEGGWAHGLLLGLARRATLSLPQGFNAAWKTLLIFVLVQMPAPLPGSGWDES